MSNMVVNTNILALNSHRAMKNVGNTQAKSSSRLSSGMRINSAADDAAGLAISEKMRSQIRGLDMASKNAQDATSLIQTAEGGMQEVDNMLQRIRELVVQVSNDTNENNKVGTGDRQKIQDEINQLVEEIDSMGSRVEYNKKKLLDGSYADPIEMLNTASAKYTQAATDLQSNRIQLQIAQTEQVKANNDYNYMRDIVNVFETEKSVLEDKLAGTIETLKEFGINYKVDGDTVNTDISSSLNEQAFEAALKGFVKELADTDASKWTDSSIALLAEKYFNVNQDGAASDAGYRLTTGETDNKAEKTRITTSGAINTNTNKNITKASISISLVTSRFSATAGANGSGQVMTYTFAITDIVVPDVGSPNGVSLGNLIMNVYKAWQAVQYWDTNGNAAAQKIYQAAVNSNAMAAFVGGMITGSLTGMTAALPSDKKQFEHTANRIGENANFVNSADMYKAFANVSGVKLESDLEVNTLDTKVKTLGVMIQTYNEQISTANKLVQDLNGKTPGLYFQVGANANQHLQTSIGSVKSNILGIGDGEGKSSIDVLQDTGSNITSTLDILDEALSYVTGQRSKLGAAQNRLEYTISSLDISSENLSSAESRIRDADMAKEMMNVTKSNVLQQAAISMLSQANQAPQQVLQLLR